MAEHNQGSFFPNLGHFFSIFEKGQGRPLPPPPLVTRLRSLLYEINIIFFNTGLIFTPKMFILFKKV